MVATAVVFVVVVTAGEAAVVVVFVLLAAGGAAVPGAMVDPAALVSLPGVGVAVAAGAVGAVGRVVMGVGTGGNGFDITVATSWSKPVSDLLRNT